MFYIRLGYDKIAFTKKPDRFPFLLIQTFSLDYKHRLCSIGMYVPIIVRTLWKHYFMGGCFS